ncbi:MAG: cytochrome c peroxidase [Pseudomonadales bacterium]|nr:cytochrome c peroxidase [Pseudomonadales bacterium]
MKNPCNPCAGKSVVQANYITRPKGSKVYASGSRRQMVELGQALWNDKSLSSNGLACQNCHVQGAAFNATYKKPYPHKVAMVKERAGLNKPISAEQMVQFCMVVPMATNPLMWRSKELAALTAYVEDVSQPTFAKTSVANPCNPCGMKRGMKNPCANPCAAKHNPCGMNKNPCGMKKNPCGMK